MALQNVDHFWRNVVTSTRGEAYLSMSLLVTELTQQVFALELLNAIYNSIAPNNLKLGKGL